MVKPLAGIRVLHESRDEERGGFDLPGLLTLTVGLFSFVLALLRGNDWGWFDAGPAQRGAGLAR